MELAEAIRKYRDEEKRAKIKDATAELPYISRVRFRYSGSPVFGSLLEFFVNAADIDGGTELPEPGSWKKLSASDWRRRTHTAPDRRGWTRKGLEAELGERMTEAGIDKEAPFVEGFIVAETYTPRGPRSEDEKYTSNLLVRTKALWLYMETEAWIVY